MCFARNQPCCVNETFRFVGFLVGGGGREGDLIATLTASLMNIQRSWRLTLCLRRIYINSNFGSDLNAKNCYNAAKFRCASSSNEPLICVEEECFGIQINCTI